MAVPDFQSFLLPTLKLAAKGQISTTDAIERLSDEFCLSPEDRAEKLASGRQTRVANRVYWTFVHLTKAELMQRVARGIYVITDKGRDALAENPARIDLPFLLARSEKYRLFRNPQSISDEGEPAMVSPQALVDVATQTPEERIEAALEELNATLQSDLFEKVMAMSDSDFETLIISLMLGMGYGAGGLSDRTGGTGDGGIDGIITEDVLGLDVIYLQAKRYAEDSRIGPDKIREFAGAMDAHGITKGVFVTTSYYTKAAREYSERSHKRLRLIDGKELTRLMIEHGIGVRGARTLEIKKIDADFFDFLEE